MLILAREMLSPDVILPNLVAVMAVDGVLDEKTSSSGTAMVAMKVACLEELAILIEASQNLSEEVQFESLVSCVASELETYCGNRAIQKAGLAAVVALRDKNLALTLQSLSSLPTLQLNIVKQLANAYERPLAKQILNYTTKAPVQAKTD